MSKIKEEYLATYQKAYDQLNEKQKQAVETIEGPVMAIAGPGTGKTQLLAVRIGNILMQTDVYPHNILCLTYTEAGAIAMRKRLQSFIGPDAYNVNIHTFHAFCNGVIKENMKYFGDFRDLQLVSDIEEIEILRSVIDKFPDNHELKRYKGDVYYEVDRLKRLFQMMKQEKWDSTTIRQAYEAYKSILMNPLTAPTEFVYSKNYTDTKTNTRYSKGDLKINSIIKELNKYDSIIAASEELNTYLAEMDRRERFDYQDMILFVIKKFKENDELLGKYQERFQYILVDEYQDTNGAQNELLFLLSDFWDKPNLFIVGDDDQSIFRFQGANMNSIIDFKDKYAPVEIVLTDNYRSSQNILNKAKTLIENNQDRLVKKYPYLVKDLTEKRKNGIHPAPIPQVLAYKNKTQEEVGVMLKVKELHDAGVPYSDIAILYTKHKMVENLVRYFSQIKVPINVKKRVNVLHEVEVIRLTNILRYLHIESTKPHTSEDLLFEILHYENFGLSALDIATISIFCRRKSDDNSDQYLRWREVISTPDLLTKAGVKHIEDVLNVSVLVEQWIIAISNVTIQTLIEKILTDGRILDHILKSEDKAWRLQLVNTFFDFVKNEAAKSKLLQLKHVIQLLDIMDENNLELAVNRIISNDNGIHFMTAHGSKGLEFDHVFIIQANSNEWEKKAGDNRNYSIPPTLSKSSDGGEIEDPRRLMYVAMTRAKDHIYLSFVEADDKEKKLEASKFVAEILSAEDKIIEPSIAESAILQYKAELMRYQQGEPKLIDNELTDKMLENFKISATSLNKYLKCRLTFYFETILRVPLGRSASMGFGNAIHFALEQFFRDIEASVPRSMGSTSKLTDFFAKGMDMYKSHFTSSEFENYTKHGINILTDYYQKYSPQWLTTSKYELEYSIPSTEYKGVPISGKLDRINVFEDHISVTDYKTGQYKSPKLKPPTGKEGDIGGDYWRQIIFYRLLLDGDKRHNWTMKKGIMDFIEKDRDDKYHQIEFTIAPFEMDIVGGQLVESYENIQNHIFTPGCNDKECKWCNFVIRNMPAEMTVESEDNIDD